MENEKEQMARRVEQYVAIRDKLREMDEEFAKKRAPFVEVQNLLSGFMEKFLEQAGADSVKTPKGTFYRSVRRSASVEDGDAFMSFVRRTGKFELLERRANPTAVYDYIKETGAPVPGVNPTAIRTIGVRRPSEKKEY